MKATSTLGILSVLILLCMAADATADTLVITYSSGKVQTVELDDSARKVQEMKFGDASLSLPERIKKLMERQERPENSGTAERKGEPKKPARSIQWAPPVTE